MTLDDSMMFHLTQGALRRWSLWNEDQFPQWAMGEERKWRLFQSWKHQPYKEVQHPNGQVEMKMHPMSEFENWPLWLVIDLARYIQLPMEYASVFFEPDTLKKAVVDHCDVQYADHEQEPVANLFA